MTDWSEHHAPRAVVPPVHILETPDVLEANTMLALASPSGFGLGISRLSGDHLSHPEPLALYYVSNRAARDRSQSVSIKNPPGVRAGWYVVAEPGAQFELYVSPLQGEHSVYRTASYADVVKVRVWVDGILSKRESSIMDPRHGSLREKRLPGFRETYTPAGPSSGPITTTYRKFAFYKTKTVEEDVSRNENGPEVSSIRLCLFSAQRGMKETPWVEPSTNNIAAAQKVSEKDAIKKGVSVGVRRDGVVESETTYEYQYRTVNEQPVESATVTIFMRERFWMVSRKIIDEEGRPCKYQPPKKDEPANLDGEVVSVDDVAEVERKPEWTEPVKKRQKTTVSEVIDLG